MRSLLSRLKAYWRARATRHAAGRPETVRRESISTTARVALACAILAMPFALYMLVTEAMLLPFVVVTMVMAAGVIAVTLCQRGQFERAAAAAVYAMLMVGAVLTIGDPAIADFGLALALLAPVHASLLARSPVKKRSWAIMVAVVSLAMLSNLGLLVWPEPMRVEYGIAGALVFGLAGLLVAYAATRLSSVFEVYEKGQLNAYRHLVEHVQDAVMRFSDAGVVLYTSRSSERLFGCRRFELAGSGLLDRIHVLDRPAYLTAFSAANVDGRAQRVEIRMRRDEPSAMAPKFVWVEASLSPVEDPDLPGSRNEVVVLFRDVTERRDHENQMKRARKEAEEASSAKSRFLATIGHELRTPLNAIVGFSDMMTSGIAGELAPQQKEYARLIHQSGSHLLEVVQMLLDMSRLEAGRFEIVTDTFAPEAVVEPCLKMVDAMAREKHVRLMTDIPRALPMLVADERACRQVLINLLSNAIKFSHEHSVVTVGVRRQGNSLAISVTDRGIGMAEDAVRRLGEPFFQAQDGLSRRYEGTGLGLSIVKGLVELHDGSMHVASMPGEGTVVTVLLPINGPETKTGETGEVTPLHRESVPDTQPAAKEWPDERKRAL